MLYSRHRHAITRTNAAIAVVVLIVVAAVAGVYYVSLSPQPMSSSSSSSSSSSMTSSSSTTQPTTSTTSTTTSPPALSTLVIDDSSWPTPTDLNPLLSIYDSPYPAWTEYTVYQPLVGVNLSAEFHSGQIQYVPILAKNWTVSSDSTTYTFNLRPGVKFSNGDPLNAYNVWTQMYGFYYTSGNSSEWLFGYPFFDYSHVNFGPSTFALLTQSGLTNPNAQALKVMMNSSWPIYVTGPEQIVFHLNKPFNWFQATLISAIGPIYDTQFVLQNGGFGDPYAPNPYFNQHSIPGTGPYEVTGISENAYVTFAQNPTYWAAGSTPAQIAANPAIDPGHVKNVILRYKPDDTSRYIDLSTGAAQIAAIESSNWKLIQANSQRYGYLSLPPQAGLLAGLALNTQKYPTNVTDVRLAIVHAINYTEIADRAFAGQVSQVIGPEYPAWSQFYNLANEPQYSYNLTMAQGYLNKSGLTSIPSIDFPVLSGCDYCINAAELVQGDLAQIGITVNIRVMAPSNIFPLEFNPYPYENATAMGNLAELGLPTWAPGTLSPADNWIALVSNSSVGGNFAVYSNPVVNACVDSFTSTTDVSQIQSLCKQAQAQIYSDAPIAWFGGLKLWLGGGSLAWDKSVVSGFYADPQWTGVDTAPFFNTVTLTGH